MSSLACKPTMGMEICDNGVDDNSNNLVDCADPQCTTFPACLAVACTADVDFGTIAPHGASVTRAIDTTGATPGYATCAPAGGIGRVGRFQLDDDRGRPLDFTQGRGQRARHRPVPRGREPALRPQPGRLPVGDGQPTASKTFSALAPGVYWVIVEAYPGLAGADDGDAVDGLGRHAGDLRQRHGRRRQRPHRLPGRRVQERIRTASAAQCKPDVNARHAGRRRRRRKTAHVEPAHRDRRLSVDLLGGVAGRRRRDRVHAGRDRRRWRSQFSARRAQHLRALPDAGAPGLACDADPDVLRVRGRASRTRSRSSACRPGATCSSSRRRAAAQAGTINLRFSAFSGRRVEICGNSIDDDANGLTDCDDPACFGVGGLPGAACMPDQDLGQLLVGNAADGQRRTRGGGTLLPDVVQPRQRQGARAAAEPARSR